MEKFVGAAFLRLLLLAETALVSGKLNAAGFRSAIKIEAHSSRVQGHYKTSPHPRLVRDHQK